MHIGERILLAAAVAAGLVAEGRGDDPGDAADDTVYVWTGAGGDRLWTNPSNWAPSNPGGTYPNSAQATADFRSAEGPTVVDLPVSVAVAKLDLGKKGADVTLRRSADGEVALSPGSIATAEDLSFTIDGLALSYNGLAYAKGMRFTVANGASFETRHETQLHADGAVLEVKGGSSYVQNDWTISISGTGSRLVVDDAYVSSKTSLWLSRNSGGRGNAIEIRGKNPRIRTAGLVVGRDSVSDVPPRIVFVIPEGGYAETPFDFTSKGGDFASDNGRGQTVDISVDPDSPAFGGASCRVRLAACAGGGRVRKGNIGFPPRRRSERLTFRYAYGADGSAEDDGTDPTALWVDVAKNPFVLRIR